MTTAPWEIVVKNIQNDNKELTELFETARTFFRTMISVSAIIGTVNITLIGLAIDNQSSSLLFIGSIFPIIYIFFLVYMFKLQIVLALPIVNMTKIAPNTSFFISSAFALLMPPIYKMLSELRNIEKTDDQLNYLIENYKTPYTPFTHIILPVWAAVQIGGSFIVWYFFEWPAISA